MARDLIYDAVYDAKKGKMVKMPRSRTKSDAYWAASDAAEASQAALPVPKTQDEIKTAFEAANTVAQVKAVMKDLFPFLK